MKKIAILASIMMMSVFSITASTIISDNTVMESNKTGGGSGGGSRG